MSFITAHIKALAMQRSYIYMEIIAVQCNVCNLLIVIEDISTLHILPAVSMKLR